MTLPGTASVLHSLKRSFQLCFRASGEGSCQDKAHQSHAFGSPMLSVRPKPRRLGTNRAAPQR